jgi:hypothetical protein
MIIQDPLIYEIIFGMVLLDNIREYRSVSRVCHIIRKIANELLKRELIHIPNKNERRNIRERSQTYYIEISTYPNISIESPLHKDQIRFYFCCDRFFLAGKEREKQLTFDEFWDIYMEFSSDKHKELYGLNSDLAKSELSISFENTIKNYWIKYDNHKDKDNKSMFLYRAKCYFDYSNKKKKNIEKELIKKKKNYV